MRQITHSKKQEHFIQSFFDNLLIFSYGLMSGLTNPHNLIQLRLQNQYAMVNAGSLSTPYSGIWDCIKRVYNEEKGFKSFWKGGWCHSLFHMSYLPLAFYFQDKIKVVLGKEQVQQNEAIWTNIISGSAAGLISLLFTYPLDYARTRLTNDLKNINTNREKEFSGLFNVWKKTLESDGVRGLYRGFNISCFSMLIQRGIFFGAYQLSKEKIPRQFQTTPLKLAYFFSIGRVVSFVSMILLYPIETIKRRMMMSSGQTNKFTSSINCARYILKNQGIKSFFKGSSIYILFSYGTTNYFLLDNFRDLIKGLVQTQKLI